MKFTIYHGRADADLAKGSAYRDIAKAGTLDDAVDILLALAVAWAGREGDSLGLFYRRSRRDGICILTSVGCGPAPGTNRQRTLPDRGALLVSSREKMARKRADDKALRARVAWLCAHPGASDQMLKDGALREALDAGDFNAADRRLEDLKNAA